MIFARPYAIIYVAILGKGGICTGIFAKTRERFPIIKFLVNAQKTVWYPILYGILCFIGGINNYTVYIPIMWILIAMHLFSVLFTDDDKVFLVPLCMTYFAIGRDFAADSFYSSDGNILSLMHEDAFKHLIAMGVIGVGALLIRLVIDASITRAVKKRRGFTWGIAVMDIAFLLNGILSPSYDIANLGFGALIALVFTVIFFLVCGMIDNSEDITTYACYVMVSLAYSALMQISVVVYRLYITGNHLIEIAPNRFIINRYEMTLGWGIATVIAGIFVLGIPAAMYLAKNKRAPILSLLSCVLFILGTLIINARGAMAVSVAVFLVCIIVCCIRGKNRKIIRICTVVGVVLLAGAMAYVLNNIISLEDIKKYLRININSDSGRRAMWTNGVSDFKSSPLFGVGFSDGALADASKQNNFYSNMYHCIVMQFPAATGILGCLAFLVHLFEFFKLIFKRFSIDRFLILCLPLMIIGMSLFDNFFFYPQFQILYCVFLAVAGKTISETGTSYIQKGAS